MNELDQQAWRGKHLMAKRDERGTKCQSMEGDRSILFVPVKVEQNATYRIHLELRRESGNGKLFCNFYANRNFDFPHVALACDAAAWSTFDVQVQTGHFPPNVPIVLRLWRLPGGTGSLLVRRIAFEQLPSGTAPEAPKLIASSPLERMLVTQPPPPPEPIVVPMPRATHRRARPAPIEPLPHRPAYPPPPDNLLCSQYPRLDTNVLVVSELGDQDAVRDAFAANGIQCSSLAAPSDVVAAVGSRGANWVHFHVRRGTSVAPQVLDKLRELVPGIVLTVWMEQGWPMFDNNLLALLRSADLALMESDVELATYRAAGCFNAELWDPGASSLSPTSGGTACDLAVLTDDSSDTYADTIKACAQQLGLVAVVAGRDEAGRRQALSGAKLAVFADPWASRTLFGLLATGIPVLARRSLGTMEWCEDGNDLRLFDTPEECVSIASQLLGNTDGARNMGAEGKATAALHSANARALELAVRIGCLETIMPRLPKDRTSYASRRVMCVMRTVPMELMSRGSDGDTDFVAVPFSECRDTVAKIARFNPDLLHIHLEADDDGLPWRDLMLDLRRRIPGMLVTAWHPGGKTADRRLADLRFCVDHLLVGDEASLAPYRDMMLVGTWTWSPEASPTENPISFRSAMLAFARGMGERRRAFLQPAAGPAPVDLTVFIGTYNRYDQLRSAVETALVSAKPRSVEVIVNDAGSTDGTQDWLRAMATSDKRIVPIFSGKRTSFTQAFNETLLVAKGKYICWLSDDIISQDSALSDMCAVMEKMTPMDMGGFCVRNSWGHEYTVRMDSGYYYPTVGCMYTETMRKFDGINMDYPFYSQDTDLDMRVLRTGGRIVACTHCRLLHNCRNDELRRSNGVNHTNMMHDVKYNLAAWKPGEYSRQPYPRILLVPIGNCSPRLVVDAARRVRAHYMNSHISVSGELFGQLDARGPNSFLRLAPTASGAINSLYDLIIHVRSDGNLLAKPADYSETPFARKLLQG